MKAFYNDNESYVCEWTKNLIANGLISSGDVSSASIKDLEPWDLVFYDRAHFFSGIAGWDYALNLAGWPKDIRTWTGSCPCQPFSVAGQRKGVNDERHLWPVFRELIRACQPPIVFGEQVASKDGRVWLAGVRADFQAMGYDFWAVDTCAAGVGAPHIRQRLYWVAYSLSAGWAERRAGTGNGSVPRSGSVDGLDYSADSRCAGVGFGGSPTETRDDARLQESTGRSALSRLADADGGIAGDRGLQSGRKYGQPRQPRGTGIVGLGNTDDAGSQGRVIGRDRARERLIGPAGMGFWSRSDTILCADGNRRRIEPGSFPLAHGVPARVGKLRAYGNAIVPQVAAEFVASFMEAVGIEPIR